MPGCHASGPRARRPVTPAHELQGVSVGAVRSGKDPTPRLLPGPRGAWDARGRGARNDLPAVVHLSLCQRPPARASLAILGHYLPRGLRCRLSVGAGATRGLLTPSPRVAPSLANASPGLCGTAHCLFSPRPRGLGACVCASPPTAVNLDASVPACALPPLDCSSSNSDVG